MPIRISITAVVLLAMTTAMVITALISFIPTHTAGISSVRDSIQILRQNVIGRVENGLKLFFRVPAAQMNTFLGAHESGADIFKDDFQVMKMMCNTLRDESQILISAFAFTQDKILGCNNQFGQPIAMQVHYPNTTAEGYIFDFAAMDYRQPKTKLLSVEWSSRIQWYGMEQEVYGGFAPNSIRWNEAHPGYDTVAFAASVGLANATGQIDRRFVTYLYPPQLVSFMQTLGLTKNARVVAVDANVRAMFANNWGEPTEILGAGWAVLTNPFWERMSLKSLTNLSEPTVRNVVTELGGEDAFYNLPDSYGTTVFSGAEKSFVDVRTFRDNYGLNIRVLVILPERDFTETIVERQATTIGTVVGTLVAMLLLSVAFAVLLTRPLKSLGRRMYKTASLQDDGEPEQPSLLSEVASMQEAYSVMKSELLRMKSFLPQSLVDVGDDEGSDEDEGALSVSGGGASEGNVTPGQRSLRSERTNDELRSTASSRHSRSSRGSRKILGGGATEVVGLNMAKSVHRRRVALVSLNLVGFHSLTKGSHTSTMTNLQSKYLSIVNKHVRDNKGFVDSFHGDHVFASFGAVSTVSAAGKRAMLCCGSAAKELGEVELMPSVTAGVAAGTACVGNMGNDSMMRFNVVGPVFAQAMAMERLARQKIKGSHHLEDSGEFDELLRPTDSSLIVATQDAMADGELEVEHAFFDVIKMNGAKKLVAFVGNAKTMAMDEWMYQLEKAENDSGHELANRAFHAAVKGDVAEAREHLAKMPQHSAARHRIVDLCDAEQFTPFKINVDL